MTDGNSNDSSQNTPDDAAPVPTPTEPHHMVTQPGDGVIKADDRPTFMNVSAPIDSAASTSGEATAAPASEDTSTPAPPAAETTAPSSNE